MELITAELMWSCVMKGKVFYCAMRPTMATQQTFSQVSKSGSVNLLDMQAFLQRF